MILNLFSYFAKYPAKAGVLSMFANGDSERPQYNALQQKIFTYPDESLIPDIQHFVFGQSFDSVKTRIDRLSGTYLFIDFGEFTSSRNNRNTIQDTQKLAATIAMKLSDSSDLIEEAIASEITLNLLNTLRAHLLSDSEQGSVPWLNRSEISQHDIVPFVAKELKSIGWTIIFNTDASDQFNLKELIASFSRS